MCVCPCKAISKVIWPSKFCVSTPFCMQCYIDDTALTIFFLPLPWLLHLILPAIIGKGATRQKSKRGDGMLQYYNCYTIYWPSTKICMLFCIALVVPSTVIFGCWGCRSHDSQQAIKQKKKKKARNRKSSVRFITVAMHVYRKDSEPALWYS